MMADHGGDMPADGGPVRHIPVMLAEVMAALALKPDALVIDGTFGAGGYTRAMLAAGARVIALDRDPEAIAAGRALEAESAGRLRLVEDRFAKLDTRSDEPVDAVVLDVGVSSMQLDQAERGFSFRQDGPLDMRMGRGGPDAAHVVNQYKLGDLARVIGLLGEERNAGRIARLIVQRRQQAPFTRTKDLASLIATAFPARPGERIHPATRTFQALRIHVNDELGELVGALAAAERILKPGGRLVVVSFHSLEDRIVKRFMAQRSETSATSRHMPAAQDVQPTFRKLGGVKTATEAEIEANPRARSAKLRACERTDAPAGRHDSHASGLPKLPELFTLRRD